MIAIEQHATANLLMLLTKLHAAQQGEPRAVGGVGAEEANGRLVRPGERA